MCDAGCAGWVAGMCVKCVLCVCREEATKAVPLVSPATNIHLGHCLDQCSGALAPPAAAPATGCCHPQLLAAWHRTVAG
jgi:hypothetical protein